MKSPTVVWTLIIFVTVLPAAASSADRHADGFVASGESAAMPAVKSCVLFPDAQFAAASYLGAFVVADDRQGDEASPDSASPSPAGGRDTPEPPAEPDSDQVMLAGLLLIGAVACRALIS